MQSDLVRLILNLAFLEEEKARTFKFDPVTYKALKKPMSENARATILKKKEIGLEKEIKNRIGSSMFFKREINN